jgi:hypothetical protein
MCLESFDKYEWHSLRIVAGRVLVVGRVLVDDLEDVGSVQEVLQQETSLLKEVEATRRGDSRGDISVVVVVCSVDNSEHNSKCLLCMCVVRRVL